MISISDQHGLNMRIPNLVKWAGGKTSSLKSIVKAVPKMFNNYYEPFFGGGALFWALKVENKIKHAVISDVNKDLVNLLLAVRDRPNELSYELDKYRDASGADAYYKIRKRFNETRTKELLDTERAAMFLYLNRNGYNGLWRTNAAGEYNVPYGGYKRFYLANDNDIRFYASLLKDTTIMNATYEMPLRNAKKGDFVFLDPPYFRDKDSNFVQYNAHMFREEDHRNLKKITEDLTSREVKVMITNRYCAEVSSIFGSFRMAVFKNRKPINRIGTARSGFNEVVITNF